MLSTVANPFELMMNPQAVLQAMESSERLEGLQRRICRPLDKPLIPKQGATEVDAFDRDVDAAADEPAPADDAAE